MQKEPVEAYQLKGGSRDCGKKLGYGQVFVEIGLRLPAWVNNSRSGCKRMQADQQK